MTPVTLRTERLELSAPTTADVDAIFEACQDPDTRRYTMVPSPYRREDADGFVAKTAQWWADGTETTWAIRDGAALAGMIGLHDIGRGNASLGYWMAPASRGRGLLTEAARAVVDWGFAGEGLALQRIEWRAVVGNTGSARIARALGFRYEGTLRQEFTNSHGRADGWVAGLLSTDDRMPHPWRVLED